MSDKALVSVLETAKLDIGRHVNLLNQDLVKEMLRHGAPAGLTEEPQVLTFLKHLGVQKLSKRNLVESHLLPVLITHPQVCSLLSAHFTKPAQCIGDRPPSGLISPCWAG